MIIIGLTGRARSGKDTFCQLLKEADSRILVDRIAFADALKQDLARASGIPTSLASIDKERWRPVWQLWGTEIMRHYHGPDYWVKRAMAEIDKAEWPSHGYIAHVMVITDVRFNSEAKAIKDRGGHIIRIERPESWTKKIASIFRKEHRSETELKSIPVDAVVRQTDCDGLKREALRLAACIVNSPSEWLHAFQSGH